MNILVQKCVVKTRNVLPVTTTCHKDRSNGSMFLLLENNFHAILMSIQHVFFSTSTYYDLVWLSFLLDLTKNAGKSWHFFYLSFSILLLKFLTLPLTVLVCLRKFPTSSDFIWRKYNFILHSKFNRLNSLKEFQDWQDYSHLIGFYHVSRNGIGIKSRAPSPLCNPMLVPLIIEFLYHGLRKNVPFTQTKIEWF